MRIEKQMEVRSCRALLRKLVLFWQMVEATKGFLIANSHGWEEDGLERNTAAGWKPSKEATTIVHVKIDRGLHQVHGSWDGEERAGLSVFTAWNAFPYLFFLPNLLPGSFRSQFLGVAFPTPRLVQVPLLYHSIALGTCIHYSSQLSFQIYS